MSELLAEVKERTGLTDAALGRVIGVRAPTVTRWRAGQVAVGPSHAARIATLTGRPVAEVTALIAEQAAPAPVADGDGTVAAMLTAWQDDLDLDNIAAAAALSTSLSMYLRWRKGLVIPAPTALALLAERLEVPVETMVMAAYRSALAKAGQNGS